MKFTKLSTQRDGSSSVVLVIEALKLWYRDSSYNQDSSCKKNLCKCICRRTTSWFKVSFGAVLLHTSLLKLIKHGGNPQIRQTGAGSNAINCGRISTCSGTPWHSKGMCGHGDPSTWLVHSRDLLCI
jgi:hypothetical protein